MEGNSHPADRLIPIMPCCGLYLVANGHGNDARFAGIARDAWRRIPLSGRRLLLRYWRTNDRRDIEDGPIPRIEVLNSWSDWLLDRMGRPRVRTGLLGQCGRRGNELFFCAPIVDRMPEHLVADLVAHELAHVALIAAGDTSCGALCEYRADKLMHDWGFSPSDMDEWVVRHVRRWTKRGIRWQEPPLSREQVKSSLREFVPGNTNGRYCNSRGWPILVDAA